MSKEDVSTPNNLPAVQDVLAAPIVFFDAVASTANHSEIVRLVLVAERQMPNRDGVAVDVDYIVTAHLRCSIQSAINLRNALNDALLLGQPTQGQAN